MRISRSVSLTVWTLWHSVAAATIVLIPSQLRSGKSFWSLDADHLTFLAGIAVAYLICSFVLAWWTRNSGSVTLTGLIGVFSAVFGIYFLAILITESFYSRTLLIAALILAVIFIVSSFLLRPSIQKSVLTILAAGVLLIQTLGPKPTALLVQALDLGPKPGASKKIVNTMLYPAKMVTFNNYFDVCTGSDKPCRNPGNGGGIESFADGYLVATGDGMIHYIVLQQNDGVLHTELLPYRIPINNDEFKARGLENRNNVFRVTDILVRTNGKAFELFAAHLFLKATENCVVLRVSKIESEQEQFLAGDSKLKWRTLYETKPCLPTWKGTISGEHGGRMALLGDGKLLLTSGHNDFDGVNRDAKISQDESAAYGKTILIDPRTGRSEQYSMGHRNPQGLYVDTDGNIWSTEHGPKGGDELNIILRGANYGWPLVTHGTQYGMYTWPISTKPGQHSGFQLPVFAWVPSIAVSNLIGVRGKLFPLWRDDLLIGSFKKALYRARIREGRVIYLESIAMPGRIRDLLEDAAGRVMLYLDGGTIIILQPVTERTTTLGNSNVDEVMRGQLAYAACSACHALGDGGVHGIGPDLAGIVGREIAGAGGYDYSYALTRLAGRWTETRLDAFLQGPQQYAPGTKMMFEGIADPDDRKALIRYLKTNR